jgi:hypothetical protein
LSTLESIRRKVEEKYGRKPSVVQSNIDIVLN